MTTAEKNPLRGLSSTERLAKNISTLMKSHHISESNLAKTLQLPYNTIHRLVHGVTTDPRVSTLKLVADYFNISFDALMGTDDLSQHYIHGKDTTYPPRCVPILGWDEIAAPNFIDHIESRQWTHWQPVALSSSDNLSKQAFALCSKKTMQPRFPIGTVFIIDPVEKPIDGDLVLIRIKSSTEVSLKDLIIDPPYGWFRSLLGGTDTLDFDVNKIDVIGVVILTVISTRKL